jgi:asparagine synthase (glutamine-hydrolysing)
MCGIAGFIGKRDQLLLDAMSESLKHRGPDDEGKYTQEEVNFAFRRMSVLDLSNGNQPIKSENQKIIGMVNGEIYNYKALRSELISRGINFTTNSDSEVVIQGYQTWGTDLFKKLRGMFAIALWDDDAKKLILARDPIGKKPLHYLIDSNKAFFSSEIKTIHMANKKRLSLNTESMIEYFSFESIGNDRTIFSEILKVQAGHYITIDINLKVEKFRFFHPNLTLLNGTKEIFMTEVERRLTEAVEKRLVADVPIGVFLSGGIDSAMVMSKIAQLGRKDVKVFTASFDDKSYDESKEAQEIAQFLGFNSIPLKITSEGAMTALDSVIDCIDEPLSDPAIIPQLSLSKLAKEEVDVVLTGDGGDELFLGYQNFKAHRILNKFKFATKFLNLAKPFLRNIPSSGNYFDTGFKAQRISRGLGETNFWLRDFQWKGAFTDSDLKKLLSLSNLSSVTGLLEQRINFELESLGKLNSKSQEISYGYMSTYLRDNVLVKVDRATMKYGLEARSPFLDIDLFEYVNQIPDSLRMLNLGSKWMLKDILRKSLPANLIARRKHGFGVPVGKWLNSDLKEQLLDFMNPTFLSHQGIFEPTLINRMQADHEKGRYDYRKELWSFLIFQRWYIKWMG